MNRPTVEEHVNRPTIEQLRTIDLFDPLSHAVLEQVAAVTKLEELEPGVVVSEQGEPPPGVHLLLSGLLEILAVDPDGREDPLGEQTAPTWIGAVAVVTMGVAAVKSYAYMDRGETVEADVHEGLETTLTVLGHKLKHTEIEVVRDYDRSLPKLMMHGGELNQVWTNLIDNAIDAVGGQGTITISTTLDGPCVRVDVADDGPGIEPQVRAHIFDPFFTTKEVGAGTGLGLDTSCRIVAARHRGSIGVDSEPGRTVFHVWLPVDHAAR